MSGTGARPRFWEFALPVAAATLLAGCATSLSVAGRGSGRRAEAAGQPAVERHAADADGQYDWRGLMPATMGTRLVDISVPLHEVLLFHEAARPAGDRDPEDCYAMDVPPPAFAGRVADDYLLCFSHDRLERIEVVLRLPADEAALTLERVCRRWRDLAIGAPDVLGGCAGSEGGVTLRASQAADSDAARTAFSMTLSAAPP